MKNTNIQPKVLKTAIAEYLLHQNGRPLAELSLDQHTALQLPEEAVKIGIQEIIKCVTHIPSSIANNSTHVTLYMKQANNLYQLLVSQYSKTPPQQQVEQQSDIFVSFASNEESVGKSEEEHKQLQQDDEQFYDIENDEQLFDKYKEQGYPQMEVKMPEQSLLAEYFESAIKTVLENAVLSPQQQKQLIVELFSQNQILYTKKNNGIAYLMQHAKPKIFRDIFSPENKEEQIATEQLVKCINEMRKGENVIKILSSLLSDKKQVDKIETLLNAEVIKLSELFQMDVQQSFWSWSSKTQPIRNLQHISPSAITKHLPKLLYVDLTNRAKKKGQQQISQRMLSPSDVLSMMDDIVTSFNTKNQELKALIDENSQNKKIKIDTNDIVQKQYRQMEQVIFCIKTLVDHIELLKAMDLVEVNAQELDTYYLSVLEKIKNLSVTPPYNAIDDKLTALQEQVRLLRFNLKLDPKIAEIIMQSKLSEPKLKLWQNPHFKITQTNILTVSQSISQLSEQNFKAAVSVIEHMGEERCQTAYKQQLFTNIFVTLLSIKDGTITSQVRKEKIEFLMRDKRLVEQLNQAIRGNKKIINDGASLAMLYKSHDAADHALFHTIMDNGLYNTAMLNNSGLLELALANNDFHLVRLLLTNKDLDVHQKKEFQISPLQILCTKKEKSEQSPEGDYTKEEFWTLFTEIVSSPKFNIGRDLADLKLSEQNQKTYHYILAATYGNIPMMGLTTQHTAYGFGKRDISVTSYVTKLVKDKKPDEIVEFVVRFPKDFRNVLHSYNPLTQLWMQGQYQDCLKITSSLLEKTPNNYKTEILQQLFCDKIGETSFLEYVIGACIGATDIKQRQLMAQYAIKILDVVNIEKNQGIQEFLNGGVPTRAHMLYLAVKAAQEEEVEKKLEISPDYLKIMRNIVSVSDPVERKPVSQNGEGRSNSQSMLDLACQYGDIELIQVILEKESSFYSVALDEKTKQKRGTYVSLALETIVLAITTELQEQKKKNPEGKIIAQSAKIMKLEEAFQILLQQQCIDPNVAIPYDLGSTRILNYILQKEELSLNPDLKQRLINSIIGHERFDPFQCNTQTIAKNKYIPTLNCFTQLLTTSTFTEQVIENQFNAFKAVVNMSLADVYSDPSALAEKWQRIFSKPQNLLFTALTSNKHTLYQEVYEYGVMTLMGIEGEGSSLAVRKKLLSTWLTQTMESGHNFYTLALTQGNTKAAQWMIQKLAEIESLHIVDVKEKQRVQKQAELRIVQRLDNPSNKQKNALMALAADGSLAIREFEQKLASYSNALLNVDKTGANIMHYAASNPNGEMFGIIVDYVQDYLKKSHNGVLGKEEKKTLSTLLNARNEYGYTPLMQLVLSNHAKGIEQILALKNAGIAVNLNLQDRAGNTALHHAAAFSSPEVMELLLRDQDLQLEILNKDGATALQFARMRSKLNKTLTDRQNEQEQNPQNIQNNDPVMQQWKEVEKTLKGFNVNDKYSTVIKEKDKQVINLMLKYGCSPILEKDTSSLTVAFMRYFFVQIIIRAITFVLNYVPVINAVAEYIKKISAIIATKIFLRKLIREPLLKVMSKFFEKMEITECMIGTYHIAGQLEGVKYGRGLQEFLEKNNTIYTVSKSALFTIESLQNKIDKMEVECKSQEQRKALFDVIQGYLQTMQIRQKRLQHDIESLTIAPIIRRDLLQVQYEIENAVKYLQEKQQAVFTEQDLKKFTDEKDAHQEIQQKQTLKPQERLQQGEQEIKRHMQLLKDERSAAIGIDFINSTKQEIAQRVYSLVDKTAQIGSWFGAAVMHDNTARSIAKDVVLPSVLSPVALACIAAGTLLYKNQEMVVDSAKAAYQGAKNAYQTVAEATTALLNKMRYSDDLQLQKVQESVAHIGQLLDPNIRSGDYSIQKVEAFKEQQKQMTIESQKDYQDSREYQENLQKSIYDIMLHMRDSDPQSFAILSNDAILEVAKKCAVNFIAPSALEKVYANDISLNKANLNLQEKNI